MTYMLAPAKALRFVTGLDAIALAIFGIWLSPPYQRLFPSWYWTAVFLLTSISLIVVCAAPHHLIVRLVAVGMVTVSFLGLTIVQIIDAAASQQGFTTLRLMVMTIWTLAAAHILVRLSYWPGLDPEYVGS